MKKFLFIAPRILSILLTAFVSIFAFDVFEQGYAGWEFLLVFLINLVPTFVMVAFIIIAWKWEKIGGWLFILLGVGFAFIGRFQLLAIAIFTIPIIFIGIMFLLHDYKYGNNQKDITPSV